MSKQNYKLIIEYDGSGYSGWQLQTDQRTVQGELEKALATFFQESIRVTAAGRTDAGVHARGQVVSFTAEHHRALPTIFAGLNSLLPADISVARVELASDDFNARFNAVRRSYCYQIVQGVSATRSRFAWCVREPLNLHDMQRCAELILGEHDFQSFCSSAAEVNHFRCAVEQAIWFFQTADLLVFQIVADRFLHNMVRVLVGTMVEVGKGRFSVNDFQKMLNGKNRVLAGRTAPAQGLFLMKVEY